MCKELDLSTKGTSKGICLLFYGPSGTGESNNKISKVVWLLVGWLYVRLLSMPTGVCVCVWGGGGGGGGVLALMSYR